MTGSLQEKNGKYYAVINFKNGDGKRKQKWVNLDIDVKNNKRKAEKALSNLLSEYEDESYVEPSKMLFCDFLENWIELNRPNIQVTTYDGYRHILEKHIYPYFHEKRIKLDKLTAMDIQRYYSQKIKEGLSSNTVIKHHAVIRSSLKYAVKNHFIAENIADLVDRPKKEKYYASFYSVDELNQLFAAAKGSTIETPVLLAGYYGLRRSEIIGLKWDSIDFENKIISISNKVVRAKDENGKLVSVSQDKMKSETSRRKLPLCDTIIEYLKELLKQQHRNAELLGKGYNHKYDEYVCVNPKGDLLNPDYITDVFSKLLEKSGLRHIRFHDLRHSCASFLVLLGYSMKDVQEWLGHADYTLTANTYSHVDMQEKFRMINSVNERFSF